MADEAETNGVSRSPGTQGQWEVSPVKESEEQEKKETAEAWNEPLKDGEYEYFVEPRKHKSPEKKLGKKRRSLRIAKSPQEENSTPQVSCC